jgi:hypothetical protein
MEDYLQRSNRPQTLDTLLVLNYLRQKPTHKRGRLGLLVRALVIGVSIQLLHWRMLRLQRSAERLQTQVMQLRARGLAEKK